MVNIYQIPCEVWTQFIRYLDTFKIKYEIKRDNSEGHTYGLIQIEGDKELIDDVENVTNALITWLNNK